MPMPTTIAGTKALSSSLASATWSEPSRSTTITSCTDAGSGSFRTRTDDRVLVQDHALVHAVDPDPATTNDRRVAIDLDPSPDLNPVRNLVPSPVPSLDPDPSLVLDPSPDPVPSPLLRILLHVVESDLDRILARDPDLEHRKLTRRNRGNPDIPTTRPMLMEMTTNA